MPGESRPVNWVVGSIKREVLEFPAGVQEEIYLALQAAQRGSKARTAKPLKGFKGASVLEIVSDEDGNTYRVVYTTSVPDAIWVLHAFMKKSKRGIATSQKELDLIRDRLKRSSRL